MIRLKYGARISSCEAILRADLRWHDAKNKFGLPASQSEEDSRPNISISISVLHAAAVACACGGTFWVVQVPV